MLENNEVVWSCGSRRVFASFGVKANGHAGSDFAKERARIMPNSLKLVQGCLQARRAGDHGHVSLTNYGVGLCQGCLTPFCGEICMAVK